MTHVPGRWPSALIVGAALVLSIVVGGVPLLVFLRDGVHLYCEYSDVGESAPGTYFCADGIGYIVPLVTIFFIWTLVSAAAVVAMSGWVPSALRPRLLGVLALAPLAYLSWIAAGAAGSAGRTGTAQSRDLWTAPMLGVTIVLAAFAVVVLGLLVARGARPRLVLYIAGGALLLAALVAQPGMLAAILLAMGLFGASLILERSRYEPRSTGPSRRAVP